MYSAESKYFCWINLMYFVESMYLVESLYLIESMYLIELMYLVKSMYLVLRHPGIYGPTLWRWLAVSNSGWTRTGQPEAEFSLNGHSILLN